MNVLVIDIGGSHIKMLATGRTEPRRFDSHDQLTPDELVARVKDATRDWSYEAVSIGFPGRVDRHGPADEPPNLGNGWIRYVFKRAFNRPVRVVNDAAMQALGAYDEGRMLFLGLGTGVGSALVADRVVIPLELGNLPDGHGKMLVDHLGKAALEKNGKAAWLKALHETTQSLASAFVTDYIVIGGGHAEIIDRLPPNTRLGKNEDAFTGGFRLWEEPVQLHHPEPFGIWRVVC